MATKDELGAQDRDAGHRDRETENKEFQTVVTDQQATQKILLKAKERLAQFYARKAALLQTGSCAKSHSGEFGSGSGTQQQMTWAWSTANEYTFTAAAGIVSVSKNGAAAFRTCAGTRASCASCSW